MIIEVKITELPESSTEGVLAKWNKSVGDVVLQGDSLADIETDKVVLEMFAEHKGKIIECVKKQGDVISNGEVMLVIDTDINVDSGSQFFCGPDNSGHALNNFIARNGEDGQKQYQVIIIGGGPAGYVAAIRCAQLGLTTAVVDKWLNEDGKPVLGGTCLNAGCIPSKALLESSEHYATVQNKLGVHGIEVNEVSLDMPKLMARKSRVVEKLTAGIAGLLKANGIHWLKGTGLLLKNNKVRVTPVISGEEKIYTAENIIIASGSIPVDINSARQDGVRIVNSTEALAFNAVPGRLVIIGAGVIGLELGSVWKRLGSEVIILEAMHQFMPGADKKIAQEAFRQFIKQGLDIRLGVKVVASEVNNKGVVISYQDDTGVHNLETDKVMVCVGRRANIDNLFDKDVEISLTDRGFIKTDNQGRTNIPCVYAIGDVTAGPMLAHKGSEEGILVAEIIAGQKRQISHEYMPWVVYTDPEIAWVGESEEKLRSTGRKIRTGSFPYAASGRALAMNRNCGLVKIIVDDKTDCLLGIHILGHSASELIAEAVLTLKSGHTAEDLASTIRAHPSLSEMIREAALDTADQAIHKFAHISTVPD